MNSSEIKQTMKDLKKIFKESTDIATKQAAKIKYDELKSQLGEGLGSKIANKIMGAAPEQPKYKVGQEVNYSMSLSQKGGKGRGKIDSYSNGHYMINGKPVNHHEIEESPASDVRLRSARSNNPQPQVGNPFNAPKKSGPTNPPTSSGIARGVSMGEANEGVDTIQMEVALFIRTLEWAKEEAPDDVALHNFTEKAIAKEGVLSMADYDDLLPQGEMKESMGGWNQHKGANVTANTKVEPGYKTSDEKQKERIRADIQKRNRDAKQSSVKEDASAGASGSSSIAGGAIPNLFTEPVNRVAKKKKKSAIGEGLDNVTEAPKAPTPATKYPDNEKGLIAFMTDGKEVDPRYVAKLGFPKQCKIQSDPSVQGVWAVDSYKNGARVIVYMAGYPDPWGKIRTTNDFESGEMPLSVMKKAIEFGKVDRATVKSWNLYPEDFAKLEPYFDDDETAMPKIPGLGESGSPTGSTEELQVGNMVRLRDPNRTTYGEVAKVMKIDGDKIYCGAKNLLTLPYSRSMLQYLPRQVEEQIK